MKLHVICRITTMVTLFFVIVFSKVTEISLDLVRSQMLLYSTYNCFKMANSICLHTKMMCQIMGTMDFVRISNEVYIIYTS